MLHQTPIPDARLPVARLTAALLTAALLTAALLTAALPAQTSTQPSPAPQQPAPTNSPDQLRVLLTQLRGLDTKAWQERLQELEQLAKESDRAAAAHRSLARQLTEQAVIADARAKALRDEQQQLEDLRKMLLSLPADPTAPAPAPKASATKTEPIPPTPAPITPAVVTPPSTVPAVAPAMSAAAMPMTAAAPTPAPIAPPVVTPAVVTPPSTIPAVAPAMPAAAMPMTAAAATPAPIAPPAVTPPSTIPAVAPAMPAAAMPMTAAAPTPAPITPPAVTPPSTVPAVAPAMPAAAMPMTLWADVAPILAERCTACHDPDSKKGGLDMTSFTAALQGGGSGKSIVPGQPDQSRLFRMITQQERPFMPRDGDPLEASAIVKIRQWIEQGAAEDTALALSFMSEKTAKQKALAEAVEASMSGTAPLPENLPTIAVRYPPRTMPVLALARSPRAPLLALPGLAQVLLLDGALQTRGVLPCELPRIGAIGFSSDGSLLAIAGGEAGRNGKALVYDVKSGAVTGTFGKERDVPLAVAIHRGRGLIALGGSSKRARVYALGDGSEVLDGKHDDFVLALEFSPDGSTLAAADRSGVILLWETDGGRIAQTLRLPKGAANAVAFHRQGRMLAVAAGDGTVRMFSVQDGKEQWQKNAHLGEALALAFGPNNRLATGGTDGRIAVFDLDGKAVARSEPGGDQVQAIAFGVDDNIVIGGDAQGRLQYFDTSTKTVTASQPLSPAQ